MNAYMEEPILGTTALVFAKQKTSFLSTGSFFQTLGKFNHQTFKKGLIQTNAFRKSLIKNTSQLRRKKV